MKCHLLEFIANDVLSMSFMFDGSVRNGNDWILNFFNMLTKSGAIQQGAFPPHTNESKKCAVSGANVLKKLLDILPITSAWKIMSITVDSFARPEALLVAKALDAEILACSEEDRALMRVPSEVVSVQVS
jgi:hypothetical protein